jgi:hypothetical protein
MPAMSRVRQKGKRMILASMRNSCNRDLLERSTHVFDFDPVFLDDALNRIIVPRPQVYFVILVLVVILVLFAILVLLVIRVLLVIYYPHTSSTLIPSSLMPPSTALLSAAQVYYVLLLVIFYYRSIFMIIIATHNIFHYCPTAPDAVGVGLARAPG